MSDSSDYLTCQICGNYEICLITDPPGLESGLFCCSNGHTFCKNCFPNFIKEVTEKVYEPNFIRKELRFLIDNNKGLKYSNQEAIKNWEEWINYKDRELVRVVKDYDTMSEVFCELPVEFCPICNSDLKFTDKQILEYLLDKVNTSKKDIIEDMKKDQL